MQNNRPFRPYFFTNSIKIYKIDSARSQKLYNNFNTKKAITARIYYVCIAFGELHTQYIRGKRDNSFA